MKLLLEGSGGKITKAVLIKLQPLLDGERQINDGRLEVWKLVDGKATKEGGRRVTTIIQFLILLSLNTKYTDIIPNS